MRPIVSYDDISEYAAPPPPEHSIQLPSGPSKRRKQSNQRSGRESQHIQHWDDPGIPSDQMNYDDAAPTTSSKRAKLETSKHEESRELTHTEIWDDSALIDAWNAANEEYEALNGPDKGWKKAPVHKSPLWYNTPPTHLSEKNSASRSHTDSQNTIPSAAQGAGTDSEPLDFNTFVPDHDPSLAASTSGFQYPSFGAADAPFALPDPSHPMVSQDDAFNRAVGAMYWCGYWTAVYHCHRSLVRNPVVEIDGEEGQEGAYQDETEAAEDGEDEDDMMPSQR
ncbi:hypothetical protein JAAARDRAFT_38093 [Jaapia argillacea MUCL 33604]|uniref:Survival motor neuron Tudor domain-containing protein n=1 Tax=Jaapia argillacea MUCL 33604 TaxID=933084 RepID=A0A067PUN9_9AGAM|nr:hypothetical protein JAAARDRAFT_38093 [Jaapia argillacea MUCL 33604]